ncbi:hypothetical protein ACPRNU_05500 [Chromobacterium vaccinii]|uniref:hypothetical protein n=1 Tax=Chromobacterium vaccinii TaxID=1108595 RepID=UPI003C78163F
MQGNVERIGELFGALPVEFRREIKEMVNLVAAILDALPECRRGWVEALLMADRLGLAVEGGDPGNI